MKLNRFLTVFRHKEKENGNNFLTVKEVAQRLDKSLKSVYYNIKVGNLPAIRKYGKLLVKESDLENFKKD